MHKDWLTPDEQTGRKSDLINAEVMRRVTKHVTRLTKLNNDDFMDDDAVVPGVEEASESESDQEDEMMPVLRKHTPRKSDKTRHATGSVMRSTRIKGREPQYMGLFCSMEGEQNVLDVAGVTNGVQRDECFLFSVDLNNATCSSSPVTRSLAKDAYVSEDGTLENIYPYAFSAKVQTHNSYISTYKDMLRLSEEEKKLWDVVMVKELKSLRYFGHLIWYPDQGALIFLLPPGPSERNDIRMDF